MFHVGAFVTIFFSHPLNETRYQFSDGHDQIAMSFHRNYLARPAAIDIMFPEKPNEGSSDEGCDHRAIRRSPCIA